MFGPSCFFVYPDLARFVQRHCQLCCFLAGLGFALILLMSLLRSVKQQLSEVDTTG